MPTPNGWYRITVVWDIHCYVQVDRKVRPDHWWGVFYLKEFWLTLTLTLILLWSLRRDWKSLPAGQPTGEAG